MFSRCTQYIKYETRMLSEHATYSNILLIARILQVILYKKFYLSFPSGTQLYESNEDSQRMFAAQHNEMPEVKKRSFPKH